MKLKIAGLMAIIFLLSLLLQIRLDQLKQDNPYRDLLFLPSGKYLKLIALGNENIMADIIYLWSIQYYSIYERPERFKYLEHTFKIITTLDPQYIDPYLVGALIMAREGRDYTRAFKLLDKGIENNPDEWILPLDAGFYAFQDLKDYERALHYFKMASSIPGSPDGIERIVAVIFEKEEKLEAALEFWIKIYNSSQDEWVRAICYNHIFDLKIELDLKTIRNALEKYREIRGRLPDSLDALAKIGLLKEVPADPEGKAYLYNPFTGEIRSPSPYKLRR